MIKTLVCVAAAFTSFAVTAAEFKLSSADVPADGKIGERFSYSGFGCKGGNVSPALAWTNAPAGTKSFAITVHDPDAPTGGAGFWHWLVVDIPAGTSQLKEGAGATDGSKLPAGAQQISTDYGTPGWGGPCPPAGDQAHRYNFTIYALKVDKLPLPPKATASLAGFVINSQALGKATFTGIYGR